MKIAVLGGGNGAYAAVADLTERGHEVRFWRRDALAIATLKNSGIRITLIDHQGQREVEPALATIDLGEAIKGAELVLCPAPATAQPEIARALAPHLRDGQVVFLPPGSFGSYAMARIVADHGNRARVAFAESGTLPWLARKRGPHAIAVTTRASRLPTGVFPLREKERALATIRLAFRTIEDAGDVLSGALLNAGPVIHPPLILMNAGAIEHFARWDIHKEGTQPATRRVTDALDSERIRVRKSLGYGPPHFPLADHYSAGGEEWMYGNMAHEKLTDSGDWRERLVLTEHRYMREDVAVGLAFLVSVADWAGVDVPVARGLLAIGSAVCGDDFRRTGRTFEALGLAGKSRNEMTELLERGL